MKLEVNKNNPRPAETQLIEQALKAARPWGLEAEVMYSVISRAITYDAFNAEGKTLEDLLDEALAEWELDEEGMGQ